MMSLIVKIKEKLLLGIYRVNPIDTIKHKAAAHNE